jgi:hypothetical protein
MMHHQQQYQLQQKAQNVDAIESNTQSPTISAVSLSPNTSSKLSPKSHHHHHPFAHHHHHLQLQQQQQHQYAAEKHEKVFPLSINKPEKCENGNKINANRSAQSKAEYQNNSCGRTVREELEASRSKVVKLGERRKFYFLFFALLTLDICRSR